MITENIVLHQLRASAEEASNNSPDPVKSKEFLNKITEPPQRDKEFEVNSKKESSEFASGDEPEIASDFLLKEQVAQSEVEQQTEVSAETKLKEAVALDRGPQSEEENSPSELYGFYARAIYRLSYDSTANNHKTMNIPSAQHVVPENLPLKSEPTGSVKERASGSSTQSAPNPVAPGLASSNGYGGTFSGKAMTASGRAPAAATPEQIFRRKLTVVEQSGEIQILLRDYDLPERLMAKVVEQLRVLGFGGMDVASIVVNGNVEYQKI